MRRSYELGTVLVQLAEETPDVTSVYLTEHGDADQAIIEAFYWTSVPGVKQRIMLHKEATTQLVKEVTVGTELQMPMASIVYLRLKEMKILNRSEFGGLPEK